MSNELLKNIYDPENDIRYIVGDTSLSEEGAAADAKKVGDELTSKMQDDDTLSAQLISATGYGFSVNDFDIGGINISGTGWTYGTNTKRVRTKEGVTIPLKVGDVVGLSDYTNASYYIGWQNTDQTYGYKSGWQSTDFKVGYDGNYVITIKHNTEVDLSNKGELLNLLFVQRRKDRKSIYDLPMFYNGRMRIQAHQGLMDGVDDSDIILNSVPGFEYAGKNNAFACETDLHSTSDGYIVCMHNATVDATTNGTGAISSKTLAQVRQLKLLRRDGTVSDETVPTLEEYIQVCKKYNMVAAMEIKAYTGSILNTIVDTINNYGMANQCYFLVHNNRIDSLRSITNIPTFLISADSIWDTDIAKASYYDYIGITYDKDGTITADKIKTCHNSRIPFGVYTINGKQGADAFFDLGVDMITTDLLKASDWE